MFQFGWLYEYMETKLAELIRIDWILTVPLADWPPANCRFRVRFPLITCFFFHDTRFFPRCACSWINPALEQVSIEIAAKYFFFWLFHKKFSRLVMLPKHSSYSKIKKYIHRQYFIMDSYRFKNINWDNSQLK